MVLYGARPPNCWLIVAASTRTLAILEPLFKQWRHPWMESEQFHFWEQIQFRENQDLSLVKSKNSIDTLAKGLRVSNWTWVRTSIFVSFFLSFFPFLILLFSYSSTQIYACRPVSLIRSHKDSTPAEELSHVHWLQSTGRVSCGRRGPSALLYA